MKHFDSDGQQYRSKGDSGLDARSRKVAIVALGAVVAGAVAFAVFFLRLNQAKGVDTTPALFIIPLVTVTSIASAFFVLRKQFGAGGITVDMTSGRVKFMQRTPRGYVSTRLNRGDVRGVTVARTGGSYVVRILSIQGEHPVQTAADGGTAREFAGELASLLSVAVRDDTGEKA